MEHRRNSSSYFPKNESRKLLKFRPRRHNQNCVLLKTQGNTSCLSSLVYTKFPPCNLLFSRCPIACDIKVAAKTTHGSLQAKPRKTRVKSGRELLSPQPIPRASRSLGTARYYPGPAICSKANYR